MISLRLAAEIRRLSEVEGWRRNTIARHLDVHHSTVTRVLARQGLARPVLAPRRSMLDAWVPFVRETFERYPRLATSVVYEMVKQRGYPGGPDHFRHRVAELGLRPRRASEAFFELRTLPGEQAQVDWAHFGTRSVVGGERRLYAFVLVLSYSRAFYVRFFYDARLPSFLTAHVEAMGFLGGYAKTFLYDNLKSAVLERQGSGVRSSKPGSKNARTCSRYRASPSLATSGSRSSPGARPTSSLTPTATRSRPSASVAHSHSPPRSIGCVCLIARSSLPSTCARGARTEWSRILGTSKHYARPSEPPAGIATNTT